MGTVVTDGRVKKGTIEAVVHRADGSVEDLGVIAMYDANPFKQAKWEKEVLGKVDEETAIRCAKKVAPYALGAVALAGLGLWKIRR